MSDPRPGRDDDAGAAPGRPDGPRGLTGNTGITGVELHVADVDASIRFYEALGFRVGRRWGDWVRLDRRGAELVLQGDGYVRSHPHYFSALIDRSPRGTGVEITVEVEDVDAVHAAAVAAGLRIVKPIQDRVWKARDFRLADPDGFFIRITSRLRHEAPAGE